MMTSITTVLGAGNTSNTVPVDIVTNGFNNPLAWNGSTWVNQAGTVSIEQPKAGTITIKGEGSETAEFDAAFINDLKLLLEVINDLPDNHPLGKIKYDMQVKRAFKKLGG